MTNNNKVATVNQAEVSSWEDILEKEAGVAPMVDIYETDEDFVLIANMPGVSRENVKLKMEKVRSLSLERLTSRKPPKGNISLMKMK